MQPEYMNTNAMLELLEGSSFVVDNNKNWAQLSENWQKYTGMVVAGLLGTLACDAFHQDDQGNVHEIFDSLLNGTHHRATCETRYPRDGNTCHAVLFMQSYRDDSEMSVIGIFCDITERKNAEATLRRSEQYKQDILDHSPSMTARLDRKLYVTFANPAYAAFFHKQVDEVVGMSLFALLHLSQHARVRNNLTALSKYDAQHVNEHWTTRPNGEKHYQRWTNQVFFDDNGRVSEYQTVGVDLTEHKVTQDALRQGQTKFRTLVEHTADVICTVDLELNFTYIAPSWETVLGYSLEAFVGKSAVGLVHPADVHVVLKGFAKIIAGAPPTESIHYRMSHADGQWHWHALRGTPIADEQGHVVGAVVISRDITGVYERHMSLQRSLAQLEQALAAKTTLIHEIHHRIKNNLQTVASLLNLQATRLEHPQANAALLTSRDRVIAIAEIHTMLHQHDQGGVIVIDDYLYTLIEHIKQAYDALDIVFTIIGDRFTLSLQQAVPLGLAVNELLINVIKHAFPTTHADPRVTVYLSRDTSVFTITIEDNGVGITDAYDPFTSDSFGMTIVRSLAAQLDGTVTFANRQSEQGLQVIVNVPSANA